MAVHRQNMSIDPTIYEEFKKCTEKKGIKVSTWVTAKMKEFLEDEKELEKLKNKR